MASITRQLHRAYPLRTRIFAGSRKYATTPGFPFQDQPLFRSQFNDIFNHAIPNTVALLSYFSAPGSREIPHTVRRSTGVLIEPTLIVTSARSVALVSSVYDSDRSAILHNCFIARTIAYPVTVEMLRTTPLAVNYEGDIAVLKILTPRNAEKVADLPPPPILANAIGSEDELLVGLVLHGNCSVFPCALPGEHRRRKNSGRPEAPWPLDNGLEWVDYGIYEPKDKVVISLPDASGSPWYNKRREVVGIASWVAEEAKTGLMRSYVVPPSRIKAVIDYAKTKGPQDPVVMDSWINAHTIADHNLDINQGIVPRWPNNLLFVTISP